MTDDSEDQAARLIQVAMDMDLHELSGLLSLWEEALAGETAEEHVRIGQLPKKVGRKQVQSLAGLPLVYEVRLLQEVLKIRQRANRR